MAATTAEEARSVELLLHLSFRQPEWACLTVHSSEPYLELDTAILRHSSGSFVEPLLHVLPKPLKVDVDELIKSLTVAEFMLHLNEGHFLALAVAEVAFPKPDRDRLIRSNRAIVHVGVSDFRHGDTLRLPVNFNPEGVKFGFLPLRHSLPPVGEQSGFEPELPASIAVVHDHLNTLASWNPQYLRGLYTPFVDLRCS